MIAIGKSHNEGDGRDRTLYVNVSGQARRSVCFELQAIVALSDALVVGVHVLTEILCSGEGKSMFAPVESVRARGSPLLLRFC